MHILGSVFHLDITKCLKTWTFKVKPVHQEISWNLEIFFPEIGYYVIINMTINRLKPTVKINIFIASIAVYNL